MRRAVDEASKIVASTCGDVAQGFVRVKCNQWTLAFPRCLKVALVSDSNGTTSGAQLRFLGCPICPAQGGCCTFPTVAEVLGTNDPRISHGAGDVSWMQQHPAISFALGLVTVYPLRQVKVPLDGGPQVDLVQSGIDPMTLQSYPEWSDDDSTLAYWSIEFTTGAPRYHLDVMSPELCPQHPSFLDRDTLIFNARRAKADAGFSCDVTLMRP